MPVDLNEHIKKTRSVNTLTELFNLYDKAIERFGFSRNVFIFFPPKKDGQETVPFCPHFDFPEELISTYLKERLYQVGPAFEKIRTTGRPIVWSEFLDDPKHLKRSPKLANYIQLFKSYGYKDGVTFPVFGPANSFGHFSFTSEDAQIDLDDPNISFLNHVCIDLLKQYLRINELDEGSNTALTHREKEVLSWVLKGKSNSVIADIMNISEHTVSTYIRRSCKKLGTSSKWSAAISAVLIGIMHY